MKAAVVISNPWNLEVSSVALKRTYLGKEVYMRAMGGNLVRLIENHVEQVIKNPKIDIERIRKVKYLYEFDREVQVPTWGYPTESAYYRDASSSDSVLAIRIPFLAINAEDDPVRFFLTSNRAITKLKSRSRSTKQSHTKSLSRIHILFCAPHLLEAISPGSRSVATDGTLVQ